MDSPLNRAHTFARKADALTAAGKYQEAICCHNRAAENVLETLMSPSLLDNPSVMSCLRQQHEHHLHQVKLLQGKQLRCANMEARRSRTVSMRSKASQTEKQASTNHHTATSAHDNVLVNTQNIEESIREADTLLQFLKLRKQGPGPDDQWQRYRMGMMYPDPPQSDSDMGVTAVKKPKGDKEIIEELRCLTSDLHVHIKQLVQESEWLKGENQRLTQKMQSQKKKEKKKDKGGGQHQQHQERGSGGEGGDQDHNADDDDGDEVEQLDSLLPFHTHFSMASSFTLPPLDVPVLQQPTTSDSDDDLSDRL